MIIKLADGLPYHPTMKHPRTGEALRALALRRNGSPVWPVMGASDDDGDGSGDAGDDKEGEAEDSGSSDEGEKDSSSESARVKELEAELNKVKTHRSRADQKREQLEQELKKLREKDLPEVEKVKAELDEAKKKGEQTSSAFRKLALTNAFLIASQKAKINWHDPDVARVSANLSELEVGDDGQVDGMEKIVKDLAKAKSFLVDSGKTTDTEDKSEKPKNGASGSAVGSGNNSKGEPGKPTKDDLYKRFPALRK